MIYEQNCYNLNVRYFDNSPVNLCIKREVIPNKGIPLPRCSTRSPETPPKFAAPPNVEKCHFRATPIWIMGKFRDF